MDRIHATGCDSISPLTQHVQPLPCPSMVISPCLSDVHIHILISISVPLLSHRLSIRATRRSRPAPWSSCCRREARGPNMHFHRRQVSLLFLPYPYLYAFSPSLTCFSQATSAPPVGGQATSTVVSTEARAQTCHCPKPHPKYKKISLPPPHFPQKPPPFLLAVLVGRTTRPGGGGGALLSK
jgi:hypothetical protein